MSFSNNALHCKEITMQLGVKHDRCYLSKKRNYDASLDLSVDENLIDLKKDALHSCWKINEKCMQCAKNSY